VSNRKSIRWYYTKPGSSDLTKIVSTTTCFCEGHRAQSIKVQMFLKGYSCVLLNENELVMNEVIMCIGERVTSLLRTGIDVHFGILEAEWV